MADFVIPPPPRPSIAIEGKAERFAVRRIYCAGRNYRAHVVEMGGNPDREPPIFFSKPADAVVDTGSTVPYPPLTSDFQFEVELVVAIGGTACRIDKRDAQSVIFGYAAGIDLTRRDLQRAAFKAGMPWEAGKAFDRSAPCGAIKHASGKALGAKRIWLTVNGQIKQNSTLDKLVWSVPELIAELSTGYQLEPGDLIFTGTPEGVGPIVAGDVIHGSIDSLPDIEITISDAV